MKTALETRSDRRRANATDLVVYTLAPHADLLYRGNRLLGGDTVKVAMGILPDVDDLVVMEMKDGTRHCGVYQSGSAEEILVRHGVTQASSRLVPIGEVKWMHPVIESTQNFELHGPDERWGDVDMPEAVPTPPTPVLNRFKGHPVPVVAFTKA